LYKGQGDTIMRSLSLSLVIAASALGAGTAAASPLDARTIPEQVDAVGHLDFEALRQTQLFGALGGQGALDALIDEAPAELRAAGKSLSRSIRAVSFWYDDDHGALQVSTSDARALGQLLAKVPGKQVRTVEGHAVIAVDKGGGGHALQLATVGDTLVLSDTAECVDRAIRVLDGKAKSVAGSSRLPSLGRQGVFLFVAIGDDLLGKIQHRASSKLMQLAAKSIVADVSEAGGQMVATARAEMKTADGLQKAKSIVDGLRALGSLSDEPGVSALLGGVTVTTSGLFLEVTAKAPIADLVKLAHSK
jgi:hypothetical protein